MLWFGIEKTLLKNRIYVLQNIYSIFCTKGRLAYFSGFFQLFKSEECSKNSVSDFNAIKSDTKK